jgi:hypothetical protein
MMVTSRLRRLQRIFSKAVTHVSGRVLQTHQQLHPVKNPARNPKLASYSPLGREFKLDISKGCVIGFAQPNIQRLNEFLDGNMLKIMESINFSAIG